MTKPTIEAVDKKRRQIEDLEPQLAAIAQQVSIYSPKSALTYRTRPVARGRTDQATQIEFWQAELIHGAAILSTDRFVRRKIALSELYNIHAARVALQRSAKLPRRILSTRQERANAATELHRRETRDIPVRVLLSEDQRG